MRDWKLTNIRGDVCESSGLQHFSVVSRGGNNGRGAWLCIRQIVPTRCSCAPSEMKLASLTDTLISIEAAKLGAVGLALVQKSIQLRTAPRLLKRGIVCIEPETFRIQQYPLTLLCPLQTSSLLLKSASKICRQHHHRVRVLSPYSCSRDSSPHPYGAVTFHALLGSATQRVVSPVPQ